MYAYTHVDNRYVCVCVSGCVFVCVCASFRCDIAFRRIHTYVYGEEPANTVNHVAGFSAAFYLLFVSSAVSLCNLSCSRPGDAVHAKIITCVISALPFACIVTHIRYPLHR